ncbi:MAG: BamA/TamA family outer membrane protein [Polyangiaceae bacterium]|nr:BamA/TamA family outer membrane protein [Polyangiaceae bacterium]
MRRAAATVIALASLLVPRALWAQAAAPPSEGSPAAESPPPPAPPSPPDTWGTSEPPAPPALPAPVSPSASREPPVDPAIEVDGEPTGPADVRVRYTLDAIEVRGNHRTRSRVVMRYVPFKPGDVIDVDDTEVELTRYRLLGTGFFRDVQFSLRKGATRGHVVLVIDVEERNTIIVNDLWMGLSADADKRGNARPLTAYAGLDVAETNLAGTGITFGAAVGLAQEQLALRVRFLDPAFLGGRWMTSATLLFNDAQDYFGNADVVTADPSQLKQLTDYAVVRYKRFGGMLGVGRDLSVPTQLWLNYRLERLDTSVPRAASHVRGIDREPILFDILPGKSVLSTARGVLQHDTRDHPFLPTRGWFASVAGEVGLTPLGSDYAYQKLDLSASRWWQLPWKQHVLRLEMFGGAISGDAPFFEQYYVGDYSDFLPGRMLGMNVDRRPPPNFLDNAIVEVRYGHYAAKLGAEYRVPLYRGQRSVYGIDFFGSAGVYGVAHRRDLTHPARGYSRLQLIPVDLTANLGFRMDTAAGGFAFAFSNVLGFVPVRGEGNR